MLSTTQFEGLDLIAFESYFLYGLSLRILYKLKVGLQKNELQLMFLHGRQLEKSKL